MKILLAVDGSDHSDRSAKHVVSMLRGCGGHQIHLVNVQPPIDAPEVRSHMPEREIQAMQESRGGDALQTARVILDKAGIAYTPAVLLGPVAEEIARYASENGCDQIVMGRRGLGGLGSVLMGSVTTELLGTTGLPVTLIK